ncbi:uncharacterized protein LOC143453329 isoform X2 [Clavelina lepadiformis]|uniref:uncharacterized protein LOC143453329 isoform X2 n=1 Tax=Clavelina lepadiformis TaxID=159417 RepID=UPI0040417970
MENLVRASSVVHRGTPFRACTLIHLKVFDFISFTIHKVSRFVLFCFQDDDDEWHKNTNFGIHLFIGMLIGLGCLGCLIYLIKCAIKSCDQDEHAQDHREHDLEMRVEEQSRSPEESRRENVVHALVHRDYDRDVNEERRKRATAGAGSSRGYQETEV